MQNIERRNHARRDQNHELERDLNKQIRQSAKVDRGLWLSSMLHDGSWSNVRKLRKPQTWKQGRLRNLQGELALNTERAETMAEYLERVQWSVRFAELVPEAAELFSEALPIEESPFRPDELRLVLRHLANRKDCGDDNIAAEFWKALLLDQKCG